MPLGLPLSDRDFQLISLAVLAILICAITFTLLTAWLRVANNRRDRRWAQLENVWEPVLLAILAGERSAADLRALVSRGDERYFLDFLLRYERRLRGVERDTVRRLASPYVAMVVQDVRHRRPEQRARALQTMGELGVADYNEQFLRALEDPSPLVAMIAAQALAQQYDVTYADPLLRSLDRFQGWSTRYLAAMLAELGPESAEPLRNALGDTRRSPRARAVIAITLASLNDLHSVEIAARVIEVEDHTDLVVAALKLVEKVGGSGQLPAVRRLLDSSDPAIRAHAVTTLARLGTSDDVKRIRTALEDSSNWVALRAARALSDMGRADLLAEVAQSDLPQALAAREALWMLPAR